MPEPVETSPNIPDVAPDYVDAKPAPAPPPPLVSSSSSSSAPAAAPGDGCPDAEREAAQPHREGECVPNIPDPLPELVAEEQADAGPKRTRPEGGGARLIEGAWVRRHFVFTVLAVAVLGILVFSQAVSALALAATLPEWAQFLLLLPLGACCLAVLWVCVGLVRSWLRLRAMRQVDLNALEELRERAKTRQDGVEHFQNARMHLERYLEVYPLDDESLARMRQTGFSAESLDGLTRNREFLLDRPIDSRSWLEEFRALFQGDLDRVAEARVRAWSVKAAGCVIASPLPLLDAALVLGICARMLRELCLVYNVRSSRTGTLILLNKAITATFIAGIAENVTERAAEELTGMAGEGALGSLGASLAGVLGPKLGEGAINAFFIHRLGRTAIAMLQPLRPK